MKVVYDCLVPEVMGYAERGYLFRSGGDVLLMWSGYFSDLMHGMWTVYGWEPDAQTPDAPNLAQVPLLREWNQRGWLGSHAPVVIAELRATAKAFRDAVAELRRVGPNLAGSPRHGEALAGFLEQAASSGQSVSIEECWGSAELEAPADRLRG